MGIKVKLTQEQLKQFIDTAQILLEQVAQEEKDSGAHVEKPAPKQRKPRKKQEKVEKEVELVEEKAINRGRRRETKDVVDERTFSRQKPVAQKVEARTESFVANPNRPNHFLKLVNRADVKKEVERELAKVKNVDDSVMVAVRGEREGGGLIEVQCNGCLDWFDVSPSLVFNEQTWKCNQCVGR